MGAVLADAEALERADLILLRFGGDGPEEGDVIVGVEAAEVAVAGRVRAEHLHLVEEAVAAEQRVGHADAGWEERSLKISAVGVVLEVDVNGEELFFVDKILDEMMDNGFPLTTEPNILKEMITPPNIVNKMLNVVTGKSSTLGSKLPDAAASFVPWRRTTVKDASNEVYVNIVEELDAYVNREGVLVKCEAYGEVQVNCSLPG
ncbi:hypothetical protein ZEAMMB73_Zm00001d018345 [Zea mays]|uniref:MHD domain-containing protein n=1 Tax=Zea mays TaxID=4577 RepID=A0A1D6HMZ4_MAIZE|nr:hypothetical protein ZEAMMB73_Zm00001d018345 [Zea mays]AQK75669.1 hypothetical protein ZEAMMB73_Zm00001d018345 [Zea mays]AQK75673.1 hypothetical protein ZEAMMB73_Zm00001d018345 [Zea mays]AQK75675.1 hypothetical protein ZEAMMB73_Zm00001d018345 [Zea mays]AQK75683.1 hypothetical protein ZEAMMB73_Zm00001d018345 [Zea mays]